MTTGGQLYRLVTAGRKKKQHELVLLFNYDRIFFLITIKVLYIG